MIHNHMSAVFFLIHVYVLKVIIHLHWLGLEHKGIAETQRQKSQLPYLVTVLNHQVKCFVFPSP